jgi:hypothetical protein
MVDATLSEHGPFEGGTPCRGINRLALVHQGDARHPHLSHRRSPDSRASDGGSGGMALEIHAGNEGVKPEEAV